MSGRGKEQDKEQQVKYKEEKLIRDPVEISMFKDMMSNFYDGEIWTESGSLHMETEKEKYVERQVRQEILDVMDHFYTYPGNENLQSRLFTQETQKRLSNTLELYGLELEEKYAIEKVQNITVSNERKPKNIKYIHPTFTFTDLGKLNKFLRKVTSVDEEMVYSLEPIITSLGQKVANGFNKQRSDEELDIFNNMKGFNAHLKRIGLREEEWMLPRRRLFNALEKCCLREFKESLALGFFCHIEQPLEENTITSPFFLKRLYEVTYNDVEEFTSYEEYKDILEEVEVSIKDGLHFLEKIKNRQIIFKKISQELAIGVKELIEIIERNPILQEDEKKPLINTFDAYHKQVLDLNEGNIFN